MKYFIPAWYSETVWWHDCNEPFYSKSKQSEFDDIVSMMNMHQKIGEDHRLIVLNYNSSLRLFLHRNQLMNTNYWSLFDALQGFDAVTPKPLDYREMEWPRETEFVHTSFIVKAFYKDTETKIYYNQEGYLVWMDHYHQEQLLKRLVFDDRGYLSSIVDFTGESTLIHYLNAQGIIIMTENTVTNMVEIKADFHKFDRKLYTSMDELIAYQLSKLTFSEDDHFIVAADKRHNQLIARSISSERMTFSVFQKRNTKIDEAWTNSVKHSPRIIVDTVKNMNKVQSLGHAHDLLRVTPFDAEFIPSVSSQLYVNYIGILIDGIEDLYLQKLIDLFELYIGKSNKYRLKLLSRFHKGNRSEALWQQIAAINQKFIEMEDDFKDLKDKEIIEKEVIQFEYIPFEINIVQVMSQLRIIIDINDEPDLYLQISAISAGVPQINIIETDYVKHKGNGYIIPDNQSIFEGVDYYLKQLKHWNAAFTHSLQLVQKYSSRNIIDQIDAFTKGVSHGSKI